MATLSATLSATSRITLELVLAPGQGVTIA